MRSCVSLSEGGPIAGRFHAFLKPQSLPGVLEVHVFDADRAAVSFPQRLDDVAQRHLLRAEGVRDKEGPFQIVFRELKSRQVQKWMIDGTGRERVQARKQMADIAVAMDQFSHAGLPQHLAFFANPRALAFAGSSELKPLKKDLPISGHTLRIGLPPLILGIHEVGIHRKGNVHIARSSGMNCTSTPSTCHVHTQPPRALIG